jgi:hypothetical protein
LSVNTNHNGVRLTVRLATVETPPEAAVDVDNDSDSGSDEPKSWYGWSREPKEVEDRIDTADNLAEDAADLDSTSDPASDSQSESGGSASEPEEEDDEGEQLELEEAKQEGPNWPTRAELLRELKLTTDQARKSKNPTKRAHHLKKFYEILWRRKTHNGGKYPNDSKLKKANHCKCEFLGV